MASPSAPVTPGTPIAIKINHAGVTKKVKLPFRDLVATSLEDKLRSALLIPASTVCHFERYSDSAGRYVVLDRANTSVYKQLLRAAKAKQKLKLRVVYPDAAEAVLVAEASAATAAEKQPQQQQQADKPAKAPKAAGPRPVTIEDVPESASAGPVEAASAVSASSASSASSAKTAPSTATARVSSVEERLASQYPAIPGRFPITLPAADANWEQDVDACLHATLQNMARNHEALERNIARLGASVAEMGRKATSSTSSASSSSASSTTAAAASEAAATASEAAATASAAAATASAAAAAASSELPQHIPVVECTTPAFYQSYWQHMALDGNAAASDVASHTAMMDSEPQIEVQEIECATRGTEPAFSSWPSCHANFTVCCNSCERHIPDTHFHCSTCEDGDFDLCQDCIALGITCYNPEHWLIRRNIKNGAIVNSTTERVPPKPKAAKAEAAPTAPTAPTAPKTAPKTAGPSAVIRDLPQRFARPAPLFGANGNAPASKQASFVDILKPMIRCPIRTCNNCVRELPEADFLHCTQCFDFDLCKACFAQNDHGHHPKHAFRPAVEGTEFDWNITRLLSAGRGQRHNAVCDGCETFISGVRHKCLNCPDWDYCSDCVLNAGFVHPGHRFLPIYEPLPEADVVARNNQRAMHAGIYCDGPHCTAGGHLQRPIVGDRYKCAVCDNKDFCATCEASPANTHNKTHPLIKFRTPVRHVFVTTTGEHDDGRPLPPMGDRTIPSHCFRAAATTRSSASGPDSSSNIQLNKVQTVVDVKPTVAVASSSKEAAPKKKRAPPVAAPQLATKSSEETLAEPAVETLGAMFQRDTVADGTVLPPNHVFEQTWVLRNTGSVAWPAGCCVRFVSGDYMGHVDPNHPAGIQELVSASESTICYEPLAPGDEFSFTVLLRTPSRLGKAISYWRLTTKGGIKFGDRLWCDVKVQPKEEEPKKEAVAIKVETEETSAVKSIPTQEEEEKKTVAAAAEEAAPVETSQMIFPKLEKESPAASVHEQAARTEAVEAEETHEQSELSDWADDDSDGFLTDEEYDILDASDEEYLEEAAAKLSLRK